MSWLSCVETDHGEKKLEKWAAEIGVSYESVKRYRSTYRKYKDANFGETSPSAGRTRRRSPPIQQRDEIIAEFPDLTVREARTLASDHRKANGHDTTAEVDATDITDATTAVERTPATTTNGIQKKKSRHRPQYGGLDLRRRGGCAEGPQRVRPRNVGRSRRRGDREALNGEVAQAIDLWRRTGDSWKYVRGYYGKAVRAAARGSGIATMGVRRNPEYYGRYWDATVNVVGGCSVVDIGCINCYAAFEAGTRQQATGHPLHADTTVRKGKKIFYNDHLTELPPDHDTYNFPLKFKGKATPPLLGVGKPNLIWLNSMSDILHPGRRREPLDRIFANIAHSPHVGQVLTKFPAEMVAYFSPQPEYWRRRFCLGFTANEQGWFDVRWPIVRPLAEMGYLVFVSLAPAWTGNTAAGFPGSGETRVGDMWRRTTSRQT